MGEAEREIDRIIHFICTYAEGDRVVAIPVSGGIDSDVVARLCTRALGRERVHLFWMCGVDPDGEQWNLVEQLGRELSVPLKIYQSERVWKDFIAMFGSDAPELLLSHNRIDTGKALCSLRTAVLSTYAEKGYFIAGCTNKSEKELGFYLPFGDNLAHFKPIAHLYKSEVYLLAQSLGTDSQVLRREPSAGYWAGQTDLEDLSYWLVNQSPVITPRRFTQEEIDAAAKIEKALSWAGIDKGLYYLKQGLADSAVSWRSGLPEDIVGRLRRLKENVTKTKGKKLLSELPPRWEPLCPWTDMQDEWTGDREADHVISKIG